MNIMTNFFKRYFCKHEVQILPVIDELFRDRETFSEVGVFNQIDFKCVLCQKEGRVSVPAILTTRIPLNLLKAISKKFVSDALNKVEVKIL